MARKIFKSLMLGITVFSVALLTGYLAYVCTYRYQTERLTAALSARDTASAAPAYLETPPLQEEPEQFLARLENNDIAIYALSGQREAFLYTLNVYVGGLPGADLVRLKQGIVLRGRQELASFEEDFTS